MAYNQGVGAGYNQGVGGYPTNQTAGTSGTGYQSRAMGATPVVGEQYVAQTVKSYAVTKKVLSVSGGDWTITDQYGNKSFTVDGRIASIRDRRFLRDARGTRILTMKKKLMTLHDTWEIYAGESSTVLATVKKSSIVQFRTSMDCMLANSNTGKRNYQIKGDFFDRNVTIFRGAEQAAVLTRQMTFTNLVLSKDTFGVTIFPGVDEALIFALIVIMDEVHLHDNGR